jgi:hypothetical protein
VLVILASDLAGRGAEERSLVLSWKNELPVSRFPGRRPDMAWNLVTPRWAEAAFAKATRSGLTWYQSSA